MNSIESITIQVADALELQGVQYLLVEAFSSNIHGLPRSTKDADFVVQMSIKREYSGGRYSCSFSPRERAGVRNTFK